jgi:hypothetical protein
MCTNVAPVQVLLHSVTQLAVLPVWIQQAHIQAPAGRWELLSAALELLTAVTAHQTQPLRKEKTLNPAHQGLQQLHGGQHILYCSMCANVSPVQVFLHSVTQLAVPPVWIQQAHIQARGSRRWELLPAALQLLTAVPHIRTGRAYICQV